jgi:LmbE family N-acetylglucosaminyl deacetylase
MERRSFIRGTLTQGAVLGAAAGLSGAQPVSATPANPDFYRDVEIERDRPGQPHKGRVLAVVQAHADDVPILCGGLTAKLIKEGYTGYLIRTSNEDKSSVGSVGKVVVEIDNDHENLAKVLGFKQVINLDYNKHDLEDYAILEMRARFIFIFRALNVDTVISFDPHALYDKNSDHYTTAKAVEMACWARTDKDYPEHVKAGIRGVGITDKYFYTVGIQRANRIIDISSVVDIKVKSNLENATWGPASNNPGVRLKERLAKKNIKLPMFEGTDQQANENWVKEFILKGERELGKKFGLEYAEAYMYQGPGVDYVPAYLPDSLTEDELIKKYGVPLR